MSDYTPITGELRANVCTESYAGRQPSVVRMEQERFERLCDAIDAIHAQLEEENERLHRELDERPIAVGADAAKTMARLERENAALKAATAHAYVAGCEYAERDGYIELPKDADGEYIRVGDVLDGYGKTIEVVEMRHGRSGWVLISRDGNGYADTFAFSHRQPDSWERIIEDAWNGKDSGKNLVARCKALAGDAE